MVAGGKAALPSDGARRLVGVGGRTVAACDNRVKNNYVECTHKCFS